jgi:hypothetical protein
MCAEQLTALLLCKKEGQSMMKKPAACCPAAVRQTVALAHCTPPAYTTRPVTLATAATVSTLPATLCCVGAAALAWPTDVQSVMHPACYWTGPWIQSSPQRCHCSVTQQIESGFSALCHCATAVLHTLNMPSCLCCNAQTGYAPCHTPAPHLLKWTCGIPGSPCQRQQPLPQQQLLAI